MEEIQEVKNVIKMWDANINEHRNGFLVSDRNRAFAVAFTKQLDTAQNTLTVLVKSLKG